MDLLRLFGMFCVVYAHCFFHGVRTGTYGVVSSVYVIPLFIFSSGYFYRTEQDQSGWVFLRRTAKKCLLPYFIWNMIYGLIHEVLTIMGIIQFGERLSLYTLLIAPWSSGAQFMLNIASWFLVSLFLVTTGTWIVRKVLTRLCPMDGRMELLLLVLFYVIGVLGVFLAGQAQYHYGWKGGILRPLVLLPYYQLGIVYRKYRDRLPGKRIVWIGILIVLIPLLPLCNGQAFMTRMLYCYFEGAPPLLVLTATGCVLLIMEVCGLLGRFVDRIGAIHYAGRCTMHIMLHHLFLLYCIQMFWFLVNHIWPLPDYNSARFHTDFWYHFSFGHTWVTWVYAILIFILPIVCHYIYQRIILRLDDRLCGKSAQNLHSGTQ